MPEQVRCPSCEAALRVPESLLGASVKCPKCQTTFTAEVSPPESFRAKPDPAEEPRSRRPVYQDEEEPPPRENYEEEDEDRPRRRRRRRRRFDSTDAASEVAGPAIALMVTGGLGIIGNLIYLTLRLLDLALVSGGPPVRTNQPGYQAGFMAGLVMVIGGSILGIITSFVVVAGAVKMKNLQSRGLAVAACILSMLPIYCCCILGLPFGIWGLVVLNKPEVRDAFS